VPTPAGRATPGSILAVSESRRALLAHPDEGVRVYVVCGVLLGGAVAVQHFLSVVVFHPGLIAENLVVCGFQQLLAPVAEL
jgi:hypothetical protein